MRYKLIDEHTIAPFEGRILRHGGMIYANPTETQLEMAGYLPLDTTAIPEGWTGQCRYEAADGVIRAFCEEEA